MTTLNPDGETTVAAILALLDAASAIIQLPADVRRQTIGGTTVQFLLEDAKALDRALSQDLNELDKSRLSHPSHPKPVDNPATAQNGPRRHEKPARPPKTPAHPVAPVLPPVFPATTNGNGNDHAGEPGDVPTDANDPPHPSNRLPFAEFDKLVRAEMKRLSMDGRLPGHKLWNNERNPHLPTLAAVLLRYGVTTLSDLAPKFGLQPPLSVTKVSEP